jgi:hypothetical protein
MDVANLEIVTILRVPFWRLIIIVVIFIKETIVVVVPPSSCALCVSVNLLMVYYLRGSNLPLSGLWFSL